MRPRLGRASRSQAGSSDGGKTFAPAEKLYTIKNLLTEAPGFKIGLGVPFLVPGNIWLATLPGEKEPAIFLAVHEATTKGSRILLLPVPKEGPLKAEPVEIASTALEAYRLMPSLASTSKGIVAIYYDRRNAPSSTMTDVYATVLTTDLRQQDVRITTESTDWDKTAGDREFAPIQRTFGDYLTVCSDGDKAFAVWTDGRSGSARIMGRRLSVDR